MVDWLALERFVEVVWFDGRQSARRPPVRLKAPMDVRTRLSFCPPDRSERRSPAKRGQA